MAGAIPAFPDGSTMFPSSSHSSTTNLVWPARYLVGTARLRGQGAWLLLRSNPGLFFPSFKQARLRKLDAPLGDVSWQLDASSGRLVLTSNRDWFDSIGFDPVRNRSAGNKWRLETSGKVWTRGMDSTIQQEQDVATSPAWKEMKRNKNIYSTASSPLLQTLNPEE